MRKIRTTICALIVAILLPASFLISQSLPTDAGSYVEKKYAGWNGVLQAWICCEWKPGGSFISWLNGRAAEFEKKHSGVYIELTVVDRAAMREMLNGNLRKPELIFYSPGVLESTAALSATPAAENLRSGLTFESNCVPVAMGGYIWIYNSDLADGAPVRSNDLQLCYLPDENSRCFSRAAVALLSGNVSEIVDEQLPDRGIDLGLPAVAVADDGILQSADAFRRFAAGELPWTIASQYELKKLDELQQSGRAPNWKCAAAGSFAWTDQLLYMSCVRPDGSSADERSALIEEFAAALFGDEAQQALGDIGTFSVTGKSVYNSYSVYAELERLLAGRTIVAENPFSEYSLQDGAAIVREYCAGTLSAAETFERMGSKVSLPIYPN